ncbi:unnamed protein product [Closterium sp. Yama58-4]|nr:unnamed protein product [Closterium sp. Yama58-4]
MELSEELVIPGTSAKESGEAKPAASSAAAPSSPPPSAKGIVASLVHAFEVHTQHQHQHLDLAFQSAPHGSGDGGDEPVQERHRRRDPICREFEDQPFPKRAKLGDVDEGFAERAAAAAERISPPSHVAADGPKNSSPTHIPDEGPRLASPRKADTDALAINPSSLHDEPAPHGSAEGASVANNDGLRITANGASGAIRDAAASDASAAGGIDELWRKAELRAVTAEVAESEARVKALEAERDALELRVARVSERCKKAEASVQEATSAVHLAQHAQYSLRAAEWAAVVGVREGAAAAEEGRRRLNQLLMLAGSESGHGDETTKSITLGSMLLLQGSQEASGMRDKKELAAHGLLQAGQQQDAIDQGAALGPVEEHVHVSLHRLPPSFSRIPLLLSRPLPPLAMPSWQQRISLRYPLPWQIVV